MIHQFMKWVKRTEDNAFNDTCSLPILTDGEVRVLQRFTILLSLTQIFLKRNAFQIIVFTQ